MRQPVRWVGKRYLQGPITALATATAEQVARSTAERVARVTAEQVTAEQVKIALREQQSQGVPAVPEGVPPAFPDGHFYSPVVDVPEVVRDADRVWASPAEDPPGLDLRPQQQRRFIEEVLTPYLADYDYPEVLADGAAENRFYTRNTQFSWLDARVLFCLLRHYRPARMIEVGSGYSSLLTADVNTRFLDGTLTFRCIEPFPRPFLQQGLEGITEIMVQRVQDVDLQVFDELGAGDVLFIDSSHVSKTGSDVNHLVLRVLPRLSAGVLVHVHDVFLPAEYPQDWVTDHGFSWNEQYLIHAFLLYNSSFEVLFSSNHALLRSPDCLAQALGRTAMGGGSLWLRKVA